MAASHGVLRVGVSSCLLGEEVRWDGGHKLEPFLVDTLGRVVDLVGVCPEVGIGLGAPRETLRLVRIGERVHMVGNESGRDLTATMERWSERKVAELERLDLSGYVLKKGSPSCGLERVRVHSSTGAPAEEGAGLFAATLVRRMPLLPVEEEGRLGDARVREGFVERLFAYRRLRDLFDAAWRRGDLVAFHAAHKLLLLAHDPEAYRALGRLVARAKALPRAELAARYQAVFMEALREPATTGNNANVLEHAVGYFRTRLDAAARRELARTIGEYRRGRVPLVVPLALVRHYARLLDVEYLRGQVYLEPHPSELMLRNHA